jgi:predicted ATPase/class 3 adenylate cyclase/DNA-binding XRE family transcriptional regulator
MEQYSFGYWLKLKRKALDLTREELAKRVGYSAATIRKIEDEERRPSVQILERLAEIFNIPPEERINFLRFARGDGQSALLSDVENASWGFAEVREPETDPPKIHLATFLFTDIESSSKLWESDPERMKIALQRHHQILQEAITYNGGTVFQIMGDAFCAAFPTVLSAVSAAVRAQQELHQEQWDLPFPIRVRMGIHMGEAEKTSTDNYATNPTLNRVARILSAGHGGQTLLSQAAKELVKDSLPNDTELRDMGEHHLKNLMYPEHLFQLNIAGLPSEFPPLNTLTHRHNLPVQVTSFIARESEIALVHEYLSRDDIRLVTLMGPPGIGKTRLSIEAARASSHDFPDGVFFVPLATLDDPNSIASTIIQALGYMESGNNSPEDQLKESIGQKQMLIVLDNCEHLIEKVASIASSLLSACPRLKMLATSRESLRIPGEWLYPVPAFDIPIETDTINLDNAPDFPALMLFVERARAVRPDFKLTTDNIQTIAAICAHLDGLPLVIELIAARMRLMSPQALLERLSAQFVLTADGMRAPSERQRTLRNAIDWSYHLLSEQEQKLFVYLSVFSGGFTLTDAESIFAHVVTDKSVPELVALLMDKSLVRRIERASSEDRYQMLVTIQEYARERLQGLGEETELRNWHLAYFSKLAKQASPHLRSSNQVEWLDRLDMEYDNIRAALSWAQASGSIVPGLSLATDLEMFWIYRAYLREACLALENLLANPVPADHIRVFVRAHTVAGHLQNLLRNRALSHAHAQEAERLCLQLEPLNKADLADARNVLTYANVNYDSVRARQQHEENLKLFREAGDQWNVAHTLYNIGETLRQTGDFMEARQTFEQSLALFQECGDNIRVVNQKGELAAIAFEEGKYAEAQERYEEVLSSYRQARFNLLMSVPLYMLGAIAIRTGDYAGAKTRFSECLLFEQQRGMNSLVLECLMGLAGIASTEKRFERAAQLVGMLELQVRTRQIPVEKGSQAELDRLTTFLREELGDVEFEAFATSGRAMTMEQAIEYALETSTSQ